MGSAQWTLLRHIGGGAQMDVLETYRGQAAPCQPCYRTDQCLFQLKVLSWRHNTRAVQDAVRAEMKALRDKEAERASDVPALMKERDECR